jgi:hypothetical protein
MIGLPAADRDVLALVAEHAMEARLAIPDVAFDQP